MTFYDPLTNHPNSFRALYRNTAAKFGCHFDNNFNAKDVTIPSHAIQHDETSCGVFLCWYVEQILKGCSTEKEFTFYDEYVQFIIDERRKIYDTLLNGLIYS